jgi:hypothetical protein
MTVEDKDKIDSGGVDGKAGEVVLIISDHLSWHDEETHFSAVEKKIESYLNFIKSGQVFETFPASKGLTIRIKLVCKYQPSSSAKLFLDAAKRQLAEMNILFSYETLPSPY